MMLVTKIGMQVRKCGNFGGLIGGGVQFVRNFQIVGILKTNLNIQKF